jgi:hypothetical protein
MTPRVQVALAETVSDAEEIQEILATAGIESELQSALDEPLTVLVPESSLEDAKDAIEVLTEDDEIIAEP